MKLTSLFRKKSQPEVVPPTKLYVRFSNQADMDKLFGFYDLNAHENILKRQNELIGRMIDEGNVIILEDQAGRIFAASITYPCSVQDVAGNTHVKWQEVGTTRMIMGGYPGVVNAMVTMQILRTFLVQPPEDRFICRVNTTQVQQIAKGLGFRDLNPAQELLQAKAELLGTDPATMQPQNYFHLGVEALPGLATHMAALMDKPVVKHSKSDRQIEIDFSRSNFVTLFGPEIRHLASASLGDVEKPEMARGVKQSRDKWMQKFFR